MKTGERMTDLERRFIAARKAAIASDFKRLNTMQRDGVLTTEGPLLLLAGAGSGKTTVLINRIANILTFGRGSDSEELLFAVTEEDTAFLERYAAGQESDRERMISLCAIEPPKPWQVLAVTFTNKAAGELRDRLSAYGILGAEDIWALTFHAACVRILRRDIDRLGFSKDFTIYDTDDSKRVVKDILKELDLEEKEFPPREVVSVISNAKDAMESPADFADKWHGKGDWRKERMAKIYARYVTVLREANALDFDDILLHAVRLLQREADVREYYQKRFRYILIDEYQDTNRLQYELTRLLAAGHQNICVVGDDDQSIYRFRGADITNILNFEKDYRGARTIRLEQNYRSTQHILSAANGVIRNNVGRKGKTLWTAGGDGDKVTIKTVFNEADEANYIVSSIMSDYNRGKNWRDNAILYRMNAQSNAIEYAFKRNGVPYQIVGGMKFFDRAEVKDMLAYLALVNNASDDLRLRRIINTPVRGIGSASVERVQQLAFEQSVPMMDILRKADAYEELSRAANKLKAFAVMIDELSEAAKTMALPEFYDLVCDKSGYVRALEEKRDMESRGRLENVQELKSNIAAFLERDPEDASLAGFLNEIALYTDLDSVEDDNCVTMMTIHSAKGLEFPCVYVAGMEEGVFPGQRAATEGEEIEEERRLCYVAMTRAKEKLTMTNAKQRMLFGRTTPNAPSRFLNEVPQENSEWLGKAEQMRPRYDAYDGGFDGMGGGSHVRAAASAPRVSYGGYGYGKPKAPVSAAATRPAAAGNAAPLLKLSAGDRVNHKTFGDGTVESVLAMGNDALIEVSFDGSGKKKLMLKTAGVHMTKL